MRKKCRFYNYRKESASDLQSRLKSRKLLGVGESSSGDIHVSKVAQVLGNDGHYHCISNGYLVCWYLNVILFSSTGLVGVLWPQVFHLLHCYCENTSNVDALRLYAAALLGMAYLCWKLLATPLDSVKTVVLKVAMSVEVVEASIGLWGICKEQKSQCECHQLRFLLQLYVAFHLVTAIVSLYHYLVLSRPASLCVLRRLKATIATSQSAFSGILFTSETNSSGNCAYDSCLTTTGTGFINTENNSLTDSTGRQKKE